MTLEVNEKALPFSFYEAIHAIVFGIGQQRVTAFGERFPSNLIPARVRKVDRTRSLRHQDMLASVLILENPELLVRQGRRSIPSLYNTPACAARHDNTVEVVWRSAQSKSSVNAGQ